MFWSKKYLVKIDQLERDLFKFEQANEQVATSYQVLSKRNGKLVDQVATLKEENKSIKAGKEAAEERVDDLDLRLREQNAYADRFHLWIGTWAEDEVVRREMIAKIHAGWSEPGRRYPWEANE